MGEMNELFKAIMKNNNFYSGMLSNSENIAPFLQMFNTPEYEIGDLIDEDDEDDEEGFELEDCEGYPIIDEYGDEIIITNDDSFGNIDDDEYEQLRF